MQKTDSKNTAPHNQVQPHNLEFEKMILGSIQMAEAPKLAEIMQLVKSEWFYREAHRKIFLVEQELYQERVEIELITIRDRLKQKNELEDCGGSSYVAEILDGIPSMLLVDEAIKRVREEYCKRTLQNACLQTNQSIVSGYKFKETVTGLQETLSNIVMVHEGDRHKIDTLADAAKEYMDDLEREVEPQTVKTGMEDLDEFSGGFMNDSFDVVGANRSSGKTSFMAGIAMHEAQKGRASLFFILDEGYLSVLCKVFGAVTETNTWHLHKRFFYSDGTINIKARAEFLQKVFTHIPEMENIIIRDRTALISDIESEAIIQKQRRDISMIIVDHIGLVKTRENLSANDKQEHVTSRLKLLARELGIPVILLAQLRKDTGRPTMDDLRGHGCINQDPDMILSLYTTPEELERVEHDKQPETKTEILILKQKNGPQGTVYANFKRWCCKFENYPYQEGFDYGKPYQQERRRTQIANISDN